MEKFKGYIAAIFGVIIAILSFGFISKGKRKAKEEIKEAEKKDAPIIEEIKELEVQREEIKDEIIKEADDSEEYWTRVLKKDEE